MESATDDENNPLTLQAKAFASYAVDFLNSSGMNMVGIDVDTEVLTQTIRGALIAAYQHYEALKKDFGAFGTPSVPTQYIDAAFVSVHFINAYNEIIRGRRPLVGAIGQGHGATDSLSWWVYNVALFIAKIYEPVRDDIVRHRMLGTLRDVARNPSGHVSQQLIPSLIIDLVEHDPSTRPTTITQSVSTSPPPSASPATTGAPNVGAEPVRQGDPPSQPHLPASTASRWSGSNLIATGISAVLVIALVIALVVVLTATAGSDTASTESTTATVTVTSNPTPVSPVAPPEDPAPQIYSAAVLSEVSVQLLAFPVGGNPDDADVVQAIPDHPADRPAVVEMGKSLTVQIRLTRPASAVSGEQFFLGFWASAFLTVGDTYRTLPHQWQEGVPGGLPADPPTLINSRELDFTTPLIYQIEVAAYPGEGPPEESYNCGFNTTQAVHVLLSSDSHPLPLVVTTLPISVLRSEQCTG